MSGPRLPAGPQRGFTLVQALLVLALIGLTAGLLVPLSSRLLSLERQTRTEDQLRRLKAGMVGDREVRRGLERRSFGYLGDFGRLPDSLPQLLHRFRQTVFGIRAERRLGAGWRGPYLPPALLDDTARVHRDPWGRPLRWTNRDSVVDGTVWEGRLRSAGPDGEMETGDDVVVPVLRREVIADTVRGVVADTAGSALRNRAVSLTLRRDGALVDTTVFTDNAGRFTFRNVPLGRSLVRLGTGSGGSGGGGRLDLVPGSVVDTTIQGDKTVQFDIFNPGDTEVIVTSLEATYDTTAFYRWVKSEQPGQQQKDLFDAKDAGGPWPGSGDLVPFMESDTIPPVGQTVGTSVAPLSRVVTVDGPLIELDSLLLAEAGESDIGENEATTIILREFRPRRRGSGNPVDMDGVSFTIEWSDGSVMSFTAP